MINWGRVSELQSEVGDVGFEEIVALFLEEADEVVARICGQNNPKIIEADLHFLKGAALNLGFTDFADMCQEGERLATQGATTFDFDRLIRLYNSAKTAFAEGITRFNAA